MTDYYPHKWELTEPGSDIALPHQLATDPARVLVYEATAGTVAGDPDRGVWFARPARSNRWHRCPTRTAARRLCEAEAEMGARP